MRFIYLVLLFSLPLMADMGKIINLELYDNQNPAIITDIADELDHVVVDLLAAYKEEQNNSISKLQEHNYDIGLKAFKRIDDWVFYLRLLQQIDGKQSDPTHINNDVRKEYSKVSAALASTLFDSYDVGLSFDYELQDYNTTSRTYQCGLRYADELNLAVVAGTKAKRSDIFVQNYQNFYSIGISAGETSAIIFDLSATYRPKSSSPAEGTLLSHTQAESLEGTLQFQSDDNFNRSGIRLDYQKMVAPTLGEADIFKQKLRLHTGMKVEREENSYTIFYISYEKERQAELISHHFELGVSLRGFY